MACLTNDMSPALYSRKSRRISSISFGMPPTGEPGGPGGGTAYNFSKIQSSWFTSTDENTSRSSLNRRPTRSTVNSPKSRRFALDSRLRIKTEALNIRLSLIISLQISQCVFNGFVVAGPIGLCIVGVDSHDAPVVPIRRSAVCNSRRLAVGDSADSVAGDLTTCVSRPVTKPCVFVQREGVLHVSSTRNCSGSRDST